MDIPDARTFLVDGETFSGVPDADQPGAWHLTWTSGPNDGYGFTTRRSDQHWASVTEIETSIRAFLGGIDPNTGYIGDD